MTFLTQEFWLCEESVQNDGRKTTSHASPWKMQKHLLGFTLFVGLRGQESTKSDAAKEIQQPKSGDHAISFAAWQLKLVKSIVYVTPKPWGHRSFFRCEVELIAHQLGFPWFRNSLRF